MAQPLTCIPVRSSDVVSARPLPVLARETSAAQMPPTADSAVVTSPNPGTRIGGYSPRGVCDEAAEDRAQKPATSYTGLSDSGPSMPQPVIGQTMRCGWRSSSSSAPSFSDLSEL